MEDSWSGLPFNSRLQFPPAGPFNSDILHWDDKHEAVIPLDRFADFLLGEEQRENFQCSFRINTRNKPTAKNRRMTIRYWCSFGPRDKRHEAQAEVPTPMPGAKGKGSRPLAQKVAMGTSKQRGCQCHFALVYAKGQTECTIRWAYREHKDRSGAFCHGREDPTATFGRAFVSCRSSKSRKEFIERIHRFL